MSRLCSWAACSWVLCVAGLIAGSQVGDAYAADPGSAPAGPSIGSLGILEGVEAHAQVEAGALFNAENPTQGVGGTGYNFGSLYTDHANTPQLNQVLLTLAKTADPKAPGYAFGFMLQGLYGSDMRTNHYLGIGTFFMGSQRNQLNVLQGYAAIHAPWFTEGGVDFKVGLFYSPQGYETIDPSTSPFYSHSYAYNYSVTVDHTGVLSTTHVSPIVDLYLGVDTGNQTTFGFPNGDPNGVPAGFVGFGLNNLLDNKLTVLALSHIGPEQNFASDPLGAKRDLLAFNDVVFTYTINEKWTSVTELNYVHDQFGYGPTVTLGASAYSVTQYFSYALSHDYTFNVRGELYRDANNYFVTTPQDNSGFAKTQLGLPLSAPTLNGVAGEGTTYASGTIGVTFKPDVPKPFVLAMVRPEIRYDNIVAGRPLYGSATGGVSDGFRSQLTFGGDIILGF